MIHCMGVRGKFSCMWDNYSMGWCSLFLILSYTALSQGSADKQIGDYNGLVVFKIECLIHIDLSRSKNPAISRSCCT